MRLIVAAALVALLPAAAFADRPPTPEERTAIEAVLKGAGYTSWEEIELDDDGHWEVDDAVGANGKDYDLKLDRSYRIIDVDD